MQRRVALFVLTGLLFTPREAHVSQIHYQTVTLAELVERSELILIVKTAKPAQKQITIPIGTPGPNSLVAPSQQKKEAPAFVRVLSRIEVQGALSKDGAELGGKTIEVDSAHWQETLALHKSYYLEGISESPIYERYQPAEPAAEPEPQDRSFIVFLRREGASGYAFVVDGAVERIRNRAAIEKLLRGRK
ncbi:MAG: hypothetical protein U1A78_25965 [Polyangia bacterium]